jgi:RNA polymerase sigma-70 factor (ECF subfamily)
VSGPEDPVEPGAAEARVRRVYAEHGAALLGYSSRLCAGDRQRAEDVVQETLLRAWRHPEASASGSRAERAWLMTVARNVAIDQHRARGVRPTEIGGEALEAVDMRTAENDIDRAVEAWTVTDALGELSPDHRAVLVETYVRGRSVAEAAAALGIPEGTVKSRTFHALRALRRVLVDGGAFA